MEKCRQAPIEHVGPNEVQTADDTIFIRYHGTIRPSEAKELLDRVDRIGKQYGRVFMMSDLSDASPPPAEARKVLASWQVSEFVCVAIYFGGNLLLRTASQLIHSAMRIVGKTTLEAHHFATEAEAAAFLSVRRAEPQVKSV